MYSSPMTSSVKGLPSLEAEDVVRNLDVPKVDLYPPATLDLWMLRMAISVMSLAWV